MHRYYCLSLSRSFPSLSLFVLRFFPAGARTFMNNAIESMIDQSGAFGGVLVVGALFEEFAAAFAAKVVEGSPAKRASIVDLWLLAANGGEPTSRLGALKCLQVRIL